MSLVFLEDLDIKALEDRDAAETAAYELDPGRATTSGTGLLDGEAQGQPING